MKTCARRGPGWDCVVWPEPWLAEWVINPVQMAVNTERLVLLSMRIVPKEAEGP